jgi:hypothetical protein
VVCAKATEQGLQNNTSSSAVELRGQFKAIERLVWCAVLLRLLHGSREDYKSSEYNKLTESNSRVLEATNED